MTEIEIAREKVIATAVALVANRLYLDSSAPGPYDDAQRELYDDTFDAAIEEYAALL